MAVEGSEPEGEWILSGYQCSGRRSSLLSKYLALEQGKTSPVLAEYLRVALAFTALGSLIRRVNDRKALQGPVLKRKAQRIILHSLLKRAMNMLRGIATNAQGLHDKLKERNALHAEHGELRLKAEEAESGLAEMKKKRDEDAKANAKVMVIFSTHEQEWKKERQRLNAEIVKVRKELTDCMGRLEVGVAGKKSFCMDCREMELRICELEGQIKEKDFLMAAVAEDGSMEQSELAQKLGEAEGLVESLKEKLVRESDAHAEVLSRVRKLELELTEVTESFRCSEREAEARKELEIQNEMLLKEQAKLNQALADQEKITSTLLGRIEQFRTENSELSEKLDTLYKVTGGTGGSSSTTDDVDLHSRKKHFNRSKSTRTPGERDLHDMYMNQIAEMENQVSYYQERLLHLEESALLRLDRYTGENNITFEGDEAAELLAVGYLEQSKELQLMAAKSLLAQYIESERTRELELNKWRKLYAASKIALSMVESGSSCPEAPSTKDTGVREMVEAAKAQQAAELAERHWYEIETFERHMRAKDERMEALRRHLLSLENQVKARDSELADLRRSLEAESASRAEAEARLSELKACMDSQESKVASSSSSTCTAPNAKKKRSRNTDGSNMQDVLESREAELHSKDLKLAFVEARLVQVQMQYDNERKSRERLIAEVLKEKQMLENLVKDSAGDGTKASSIKNAIATACLEVEKLSERIAEAREQIIMQTGTKTNGQHRLEGFMQQASEVSASGNALKKIQGLLFNKRDVKQETNQSSLVTKSETTVSVNGAIVPRSSSETLERTTYAPILMKEQLQLYQSLFQRMNELSAQAEEASLGDGGSSTSTHHLGRAVELQKEVNLSGRNLSLITTEEHVGLQGAQLLRQHLTEIQRRLELKIRNMVSELRARVDVNFQRSSHRPVRLRRSSSDSVLKIQSQQTDVSR